MIVLEWLETPACVFDWIGPSDTLPPLRSPSGAVLASIIGPQGRAGGNPYLHTQASPSHEWVVNHNLGFRPSVTVFSPGGVEVGANPVHLSTSQLRIYFAAPQSGSAHCI